MFSLLAGDTSTTLDSKLTADTSPGRYVHSHNIDENTTDHYEEYARITGCDADYNDSDDLTFPGFRPMRHYLDSEPARYLVTYRRWSEESDSRRTVGQKNVIIIFVCIATIEECLVDKSSENLLPVDAPFEALMEPLGMLNRTTGRSRNNEFLSTIRGAFVKSRSEEIKYHLANGTRSPPEPSNLSALGKMLLDVMDRHIAFLLTKRPLARLCASESFRLDTLLRLRLIQIRNLLGDKRGVDKCFTIFVPTIPEDQQTPWPRSGMAAAWEAAQAKSVLIANKLLLGVDSEPSKHPKHDQPTTQEAPDGGHKPSDVNPVSTIPGIPADGRMFSSQVAPSSSAEHPNSQRLGALSGLQLFKTVACQVHKVIGASQDSISFRDFIGRIEHDVQQFHADLQVGLALPTAGSIGATGILGSEMEVLLERQHIGCLLNAGLHLIRDKWKDRHLTDDFRQKILIDILEELRKIEEAADQVCSGQA